MPLISEINTVWTGPGHSPKVNVMYFFGDTGQAGIRAFIGDFWTAISGNISNDVQWSVAREGKVLNDQTGDVVSWWNDASTVSGVGANNNEILPDSTQLLLQWFTGQVVNNRRLRGRTYVPGLGSNMLVDGNVQEAYRTTVRGAQQTFLTDAPLMVWHRPVSGSASGQALPVIDGDVWKEWAVQRRRRG